MNIPEGVISLDSKNDNHVRAAAELHARLLPDSPIPRLGEAFMRRFYYKKLIADDLIRCDFYVHGGRPIAFAVYTRFPFDFMERGKRRHFLPLLGLLTAGLLTKPARMSILWDIVSKSRRRGRARAEAGTGELLSFGILPDFSFIKDETGKRASCCLFEHTLKYFRQQGFERVQMTIRRDNKPSLLFFNSYGGVVCQADYVDEQSCLVCVPL